MTEDPPYEQATLSFSRPSGDHEMPVDVLIDTLKGIQRAVLLFASADRASMVVRRFRPTDELKKAYEVRCGPLKIGSVAIRLSVGRDQSGTDNGSAHADVVGEGLLSRFQSFYILSPIPGLMRLSGRYLKRSTERRFFRTVWTTFPGLVRLGTPIFAADNGKPPLRLDAALRESVHRFLLEPVEQDEKTIIARLDRLNFSQNLVHVYFEPTHKRIACPFDFDEEDRLFENRRRLVEVTGVFTQDAEGNPISCVSVRQILPHDLSEVMIEFVVFRNRRLVITPPLRLLPKT